MAFHDVRLPEDVEQGAVGGPAFQTTVLPMSSGNEQRNADWSATRGAWDIAYGIDTKAYFDTVKQFFYARRGKWAGFRFKDWTDFQVVGGFIGVGDGVTNTFQLAKIYEPLGPLPYTRRITRPVTGTTTIYVNGIAIPIGQWSIPTAGTGLIVTNTPPAFGLLVTFDTDFDVPARFDTDKFEITLETSDSGAIGQLPIVEIRE